MSELLALLDVPLEAAPRGQARAVEALSVGDGDAGETARLASRARHRARRTAARCTAAAC